MSTMQSILLGMFPLVAMLAVALVLYLRREQFRDEMKKDRNADS